ncbi:MBT domain-containing protein 1-like isoform X2 [Gordionus sp. m RMFG-2023]|uniref:MBT domain-containing protein 1-like isoform X2 n=1 Tax=Gordionus sp. m RMFG-2023 TaxID=3053472 RepID=UPI0031FC0BF5
MDAKKFINKGRKSISLHSQLIQRPLALSPTATFSFIMMNKTPSDSYTWDKLLAQNENVYGAPVSCFRHLPLSDGWEQITEGLKLEIINIDCDASLQGYWIARYFALLRYEGYQDDNSNDFWINLANPDVHEVGWSSTNQCQLIPPKNIQHKFEDWKNFLVETLVGAKTLPSNFHDKLMRCLESRFRPGMRLEALDKNDISAMRPCIINKVVGQRLHLIYLEPGKELSNTESIASNGASKPPNSLHASLNDHAEVEGFWCHQSSPLIHPVGWSALVGHKVTADKDYIEKSKELAIQGRYSSDYAPYDLFTRPTRTLPPNSKFEMGMKLEALDPVNLSSICVATIRKVLERGYVMISIDGAPENVQNVFCYHSTSPYIFPLGFCKTHGIELTQPRDYTSSHNVIPNATSAKRFDWDEYLDATKSHSIPDIGDYKEDNLSSQHPTLAVGMKLEAVDLMEPHLMCVATVTREAGRLLKIHFDGWDRAYDQWVDRSSSDLFAPGWCELAGYRLEPSPTASITPESPHRESFEIEGKKRIKRNSNSIPNHKRSNKLRKSKQ